jgi:hypothetical protein
MFLLHPPKFGVCPLGESLDQGISLFFPYLLRSTILNSSKILVLFFTFDVVECVGCAWTVEPFV